ncbi:MAG: ribosome silencing factor [Rickettsiaceae bacterium]|nr:ribosome silencing factor [Rickettsiaceae bacterium]
MINSTEDLKNHIINLLEDKKAENITIIPLGENIPLAKYIIIASGRSVKNVSAIAEHVSSEIHAKTNLNIGLEGVGSSDWALVDCGDVIVHIFHPEARERFKLEDLWRKKREIS